MSLDIWKKLKMIPTLTHDMPCLVNPVVKWLGRVTFHDAAWHTGPHGLMGLRHDTVAYLDKRKYQTLSFFMKTVDDVLV